MPPRPKKNSKTEKNNFRGQKTQGQFRIISGEWRSRRLKFVEVEGLRPTTDRVRETVFNWLSAQVHGAKVLDLFAGSGALGFEALSRGASQVDFVELQKPAAKCLKENIELLKANARVYEQDALAWLEHVSDGTKEQSYDLVFLDPPFRKGLLTEVLERLDQGAMLAPDAWVYLEQESEAPLPTVPASWQLIKQAKAGQVSYLLYDISASE